jgi:energy-coupling factor transporter transmembrane protein EcfT
MSYLRYVCLFAYNGVQHILCCVFVLFFFVLCTLCCQFLWIVLFWIAPSVFSNVYFLYKHFNHVSLNYKEKYDYDL